MRRWLRTSVWALLIAAALLSYLQLPAQQRSAWWSSLRQEVRERVARPARDEQDGAGMVTAAESNADTEHASMPAGDDDGDEASVPSRVRKAGGLNAVRLSVEEQQQTGVRLQTLERTTHLHETLAAGRVLDIQPLVDLRVQYHTAHGEQEISRAAIAASARAVERLRMLNREDGNVSARQLQEAESQAAADNARLAAATRRQQDIRSQALLQWGETLVDMALAGDSPLFEHLLAHQDVLVLVTLRPGEELPETISFIYVGPTGERVRARKAYLVSPAAQTDAVSQGETYFFRANASRLRVGMRMDARIPQPGQPPVGVEVPGAAIVWYANRPWIYARLDAETFVRRPLQEYVETRDGWFVTRGLEAGDAVVTAGAQMLFSEEFRSSIPSEDEARE